MKARWLGGLAAGLLLALSGCNGQDGMPDNSMGGAQARHAVAMPSGAQDQVLATAPRPGPAVPEQMDRPGGSWTGYGGNANYVNAGNANGDGMAAPDGGFWGFQGHGYSGAQQQDGGAAADGGMPMRHKKGRRAPKK